MKVYCNLFLVPKFLTMSDDWLSPCLIPWDLYIHLVSFFLQHSYKCWLLDQCNDNLTLLALSIVTWHAFFLKEQYSNYWSQNIPSFPLSLNQATWSSNDIDRFCVYLRRRLMLSLNTPGVRKDPTWWRTQLDCCLSRIPVSIMVNDWLSKEVGRRRHTALTLNFMEWDSFRW